jgi:hypothetical protein
VSPVLLAYFAGTKMLALISGMLMYGWRDEVRWLLATACLIKLFRQDLIQMVCWHNNRSWRFLWSTLSRWCFWVLVLEFGPGRLRCLIGSFESFISLNLVLKGILIGNQFYCLDWE